MKDDAKDKKFIDDYEIVGNNVDLIKTQRSYTFTNEKGEEETANIYYNSMVSYNDISYPTAADQKLGDNNDDLRIETVGNDSILYKIYGHTEN